MLIVDVLNTDKDFLHCLKVFLFAGMLGFQAVQNIVNIHDKKKLMDLKGIGDLVNAANVTLNSIWWIKKARFF